MTGIDTIEKLFSPFFFICKKNSSSNTYIRVICLTASRTVMFSKSSFSISVLATDLPLPTAHPR
jgi:hypothetical protein